MMYQSVIGRNNIALVYNGKLMGRHIYSLAPYTIRLEFTKADYHPYIPSPVPIPASAWTKVEGVSTNQWDLYWPYSDWSELFKDFDAGTHEGGGQNDETYRIIDAGDLSGVTNMRETFWGSYITETCWLDTSNVTDMNSMFRGATRLVNPPDLITNKVTDMGYMFDECYSITEAPALTSTKNVTNMEFMFHNCIELRHVPLLNVSSLENFAYAFYNCPKVESGALAMYNAASQKIPAAETSKYECAFTDCGRDTVTGAAELAQIPESWKAS